LAKCVTFSQAELVPQLLVLKLETQLLVPVLMVPLCLALNQHQELGTSLPVGQR
jgi:hypothetical protein